MSLEVHLKAEEDAHMEERCLRTWTLDWTRIGIMVSCNCSQNQETPKWLPLDQLLGTVL